MNFQQVLLPALGYGFGCLGAHFVVGPAVRKLWSISDKYLETLKAEVPKDPIHAHETVSFWHGVTERAVYVTCIILAKPEGIAVWLAFKAVQRWKISEDGPDPRHVPGSLIYMIGTALNVAFGILGGFIAHGRWGF